MLDLAILGRTSRDLQNASGKISRERPQPLSTGDYELLMGFGIASDWIGWAHALKEITYTVKRRTNSDRAASVNEATRFMFMWSAANALFARPMITDLIAHGNPRSELDRFRILYSKTAMDQAEKARMLSTLHSLLGVTVKVSHFPWPTVNTYPTLLELIFHKHTVPDQQSMGIGRKMQQAIVSNNLNHLDLPDLIYATRNWTVHGVLLSSSFRGTSKKFKLWIDTANNALGGRWREAVVSCCQLSSLWASNIAMHLSRHQCYFSLFPGSLRPGDGERYTVGCKLLKLLLSPLWIR